VTPPRPVCDDRNVDHGHEELPGRRLPSFARALARGRRGHVPAHALPPAERHKPKRTRNGRKPKRHAVHDRVRTATVLGARRALSKLRQWALRTSPVLRIPDVADMLVIHESVWQRGARMAATPAFGVATVAYLVGAVVVVGAMSSPTPTDGPTTHNAGIDPLTAPAAVSDGASSSRRPDEREDAVPALHIDPQSFAALQRTLSDLDKQADQGQPKYRQQGVDQADIPASDTALPEASVVAPPPDAVADPNAQTADTPAAHTPAPEASAVAPPPDAVANPNGQTGGAVSQPPLGPLPGPAA
jgi:hypothetical protein